MYGVIRLWCIGNGYTEMQDASAFGVDALFGKDGRTIGFIYTLDKPKEKLRLCVEEAVGKADELYTVTTSKKQVKSLQEWLPLSCGIYYAADAFGFGNVAQVVRKATPISA